MTWVGVACDSDLPNYNEVTGFRLLALRSEPADLVAGNAVTISALVVGEERPSFEWSWCPVTLGAAERHSCAISEDQLPNDFPSLQVGTSTTAELTWPESRTPFDELCALVEATDAPVDAPRLDCASSRPSIWVRLEVTNDAGTTIVALQPVPIAGSQAEINNHPTLGEITFDVSGDAGTATATVAIRIDVPESASETVPDEAGTRQEILRATWFITDGETDQQRTAFFPDESGSTFSDLTQNTWFIDRDTRSPALYLVLRDDRGGVSWRAAALPTGGLR